MSNTQSKYCDLCNNPYPYMCSECQEALFDEAAIQEDEKVYQQSVAKAADAPAKIYVGSGEDVILEML